MAQIYHTLTFSKKAHRCCFACDQADYLSGRELVETEQRDAVRWEDLVVVSRVGERERQHPLLLQVRLCNWENGIQRITTSDTMTYW